ncbi:MAG: CopG family transcriptional regulator [Bacteroidales bacterium]|nr:CopG family transcriptional regulator [Bacteroidales bacterium]
MDKEFIIKPKEEKTVTFTVRIDKEIQEKFDELANKSGYSRNYLINRALKFALENLKFEK